MKNRRRTPSKARSLTVTALAEGLRLSRRQVNRLQAAGMPSDSLASARQWRTQRETERAAATQSKAAALLRWRHARRQLAELELRIAKGELVDRATAKSAFIEQSTEAKRRLLSLHRLAPRLVGKSRGEIKTMLDAALDHALEPLRRPLVLPARRAE